MNKDQMINYGANLYINGQLTAIREQLCMEDLSLTEARKIAADYLTEVQSLPPDKLERALDTGHAHLTREYR